MCEKITWHCTGRATEQVAKRIGKSVVVSSQVNISAHRMATKQQQCGCRHQGVFVSTQDQSLCRSSKTRFQCYRGVNMQAIRLERTVKKSGEIHLTNLSVEEGQ